MAWKGVKHTNPGEGIETLEEWMGEELHELESGEDLPETASDGSFFFKTDEHRLYIYVTD